MHYEVLEMDYNDIDPRELEVPEIPDIPEDILLPIRVLVQTGFRNHLVSRDVNLGERAHMLYQPVSFLIGSTGARECCR